MSLKRIPLSQGYFTLVDDADYMVLSQHNWWVSRMSNNYVYAVGRIGGKPTALHRFLMQCPANMVVDHINRNALDNRRCNLHICTTAENGRNQRKLFNEPSPYAQMKVVSEES